MNDQTIKSNKQTKQNKTKQNTQTNYQQEHPHQFPAATVEGFIWYPDGIIIKWVGIHGLVMIEFPKISGLSFIMSRDQKIKYV